MAPGRLADLAAALQASIGRVIVGKPEPIRLAIAALLAGGHALIEDVPGVGKTMLARALARSVAGEFKRIQCTPDLLPTDITGVSVYNQASREFEFQPGPVFANIVLADEINRATPRTQSSLLEAMEESQVTSDGVSRPLPRPFFVIATQNPIEFEGTYPLPISQLDRFLVRLRLGYLAPDDEKRMLAERKEESPLARVEPVCAPADICALQEEVRRIRVEDSLYDYVVAITQATRQEERLALGASPRTTLALFRLAQALAFLAGRDYLVPDDIKAAVLPVLAHRVVARTPVQFRGQSSGEALAALLERIPVPL